MIESLFTGTRRLLMPMFLFALPVIGSAAESGSLPEPLTLEAALQFADSARHFQIQSSEQKIRQAQAEAAQTQSVNDLSINLSGRLRGVGASDAGEDVYDDNNDSALSLFIRKPLYDFGETARRDELGQLNTTLRQLEKAYLIEQREISITQKYFDVLNADNEYLRHNEDLAIGFIRYDRARENKELGLGSEIEVLETQAAYESIRQNRYQSENMQRLTRILLAEELGLPDSPSSELATPELMAQKEITDDVDLLVEQAFKHSFLLKIQQGQLALARQAIRLADHQVSPKLDAELELSDYAREGSTRDDWRATLYFDFPLYSGDREKSTRDIAIARHRQALSDLQKVRSEVRIQVLQLWQAIRQNSLRLGGEMINQEYRDMYLDRSRAEYELEFKTDLGDAMVEFSNSRMNVFRARFALEIAWRKLEKLVGRDFLNQLQSLNDG